MKPSVWTRIWDAIKPPPAVPRPKDAPRGLNPTQKKIIWASILLVVVIGGLWQGYNYIATAPLRAQNVYDQAMANMTPGRYADAVRLFTKAVDIYPQLSVAYLERGNAENALGEIEGAIADYDKAIEMGNLAAAYTARGRVYLKRGDVKRAEGDFTRSIGLEASSDAYFQLGQINEAAGDHEHAIMNYDQALHIQPDSPDIYLARGQAKKAKGDDQGALDDRNQAYAIEHRLRR
jgi:tetratricopeptide (TPR) repeat protein